MSKLSVIMPVYNVKKFLEKSVNSVLAQTVEDWELILVDDGSIDGSGEICDYYASKDSRITVVHKINAGAGSARNCGLLLANGEFVVFPDSDDWIDKDAYRECMERMEKDAIDLLLFGSINTVYSESGDVLQESKGKTADITLLSQKECRERWIDLVTELPMDGPSNKMYKMQVIRENKVSFPDIRRMQDGVFNMRYYNHIKSFCAIPECYYHFTLHSASYQRKKIPASFIDCAVYYHRTAIEMLSLWGLCDITAEKKLGEWFSETVLSAELEFFPQNGKNFGNRYRHIKEINKHPYVVEFYKRYKTITKLNKREVAIHRKWNFLLTLYTLIR